MHERVGRLIEILGVGVAAAFSGAADLHDELTVPGELQDLMIVRPVAADPHEAFRIDIDAVLGVRPLVARAGSTPRADELPFGCELDDRRSGPRLLVSAQRAWTLQDPDVVLAVHRYAGHLSELPVVGNRRPGRIDAKRRHSAILRNSGGNQADARDRDDDRSYHTPPATCLLP
jgi:hypothetical protein